MKKLICLLCVLALLCCMLVLVSCKDDVTGNGGGEGTTDTTPDGTTPEGTSPEGTTPPGGTIPGGPTPENPGNGVVEGTNDPAGPDQSW